jgi:hypothetical protein
VEVGTPGLSVYRPVLLAAIGGELWLEAHPDVYRRGPRDPLAEALSRAGEMAPSVPVDVSLVGRVLKERDGRPHRIDVPPLP